MITKNVPVLDYVFAQFQPSQSDLVSIWDSVPWPRMDQFQFEVAAVLQTMRKFKKTLYFLFNLNFRTVSCVI